MKRALKWIAWAAAGVVGLFFFAVFTAIFFSWLAGDLGSDEASSSKVDAQVERTIDRWTRAWSESQAASVRETCAENPDCDASQYKASAEPKTSFGWDGASEITKMNDWAEGRRYIAVANGRKLLFYLNNGNVVSVYEVSSDSKEVVCKGSDCDVD